MHLDRRTHRGDPPAWLPAFWSKPGIYPLSPESVSIIQMVARLPFDRHSTTTTTSTSPSTVAAGMLGGGQQPLFPGNIQPNMFMPMGGLARNMMMESTQPMIPMVSPLLQQQQYQRMLQYQQQLQSTPVASVTPSPSPSSYTQRKPITPHCLPNNSIPHLQFASSISSPTPNKVAKKQQSTPPSTPTISKIQRKQVKKTTAEKRRVRFTEDQPQVNVFETEAQHSMDDDIYQHAYYDGPTDDDDDYYYYSDDDPGVYDHYDENDYDLRHYPDHDYYDNCQDTDDNYPIRASRSNSLRHKSLTMATPFYGDFEDDMADDYYGDDRDHYYYSNDSYEKDQLHQPRSSMDYEMIPRHDTSSQYHYARRRHSARTPSSGAIQTPQQPQQQQHHSSMARRPPTSSTNPQMWQPSRGNHLH